MLGLAVEVDANPTTRLPGGGSFATGLLPSSVRDGTP